MKINDWCAAVNGITRHAYYYWLRKIRKNACQNLPMVTESQKITTFKQLQIQESIADTQAFVIIHLLKVRMFLGDIIQQFLVSFYSLTGSFHQDKRLSYALVFIIEEPLHLHIYKKFPTIDIN